jgi:hypothetical protein
MCYVTQVTRRSRGQELGQESMCNRVLDRYEDEVAHTLVLLDALKPMRLPEVK